MNQLDLFTFDTPTMPKLDLSRCYTKPINYETASKMVLKYHYAHRVPSISFAIGIYIDDVLAGCTTFNTVFANIASAICGEKYTGGVFELARLFIHDWAGRNSESWLIGESFKWLTQERPDILILLSYADSAQGHLGIIYQATNWIYTGIGGTSDGDIFLNGKRIHSRSLRYRFGTRSLAMIEKLGHKVEQANATQKHRYIYFLGNRRQRRELRKALKWPVLPYPK